MPAVVPLGGADAGDERRMRGEEVIGRAQAIGHRHQWQSGERCQPPWETIRTVIWNFSNSCAACEYWTNDETLVNFAAVSHARVSDSPAQQQLSEVRSRVSREYHERAG